MEMRVSEKKSLYESTGEKGKRGFENLECYQKVEQSLRVFMAYVHRQPAVSQDFGNQRMSEEPIDYDVSSLEEGG
jgi:hypothetical protein